ncbi:MAG: glycosyltransferase family protein [bacterium]
MHIHVQHLLGGGHLVRMKALAAALVRAGHQVVVLSGGLGRERLADGASTRHADGYRLVQLPAIQTAPGDFTTLLDRDGAPVTDAFKRCRSEQLLHRIRADAPQVVLVETFPFGRRALRFELLPLMRLLGEIKPRPLVLCSLRDILQRRAPKRDAHAADAVDAWFDHVLVHADPAVATLRDTFPLAARLHGRVFHSGYVHSRPQAPRVRDDAHELNGVVVSAGAGAVGFELLQTALQAKAHSALHDRVWRLLVGEHAPQAQFDALRRQAGDGVVVERNRADFIALLARCAVSVSQAGYNTVLDVVAAGCRAVLAPFAQHGETEQTHRAELFARLGRAVALAERDLAPRTLAAAIDRAARLDLSACRPIDLNGAAATVEFIERHASPSTSTSTATNTAANISR